ncbi:MAG: hypothetical protein TH68_10125, partial [Candidatus Synechococcus spongiarum 142]
MNIEVTYRLSTPLFCSGADPDQPEFRLPSFKGVLRYWWRGLAWSRYGGNLQAIKQAEDTLFGGANVGQSRVSMMLLSQIEAERQSLRKVKEVLTIRRQAIGNGTVVGEGARYLGYGVMEAFESRKKGTQAGQLTRACLLAPLDFTIQLRVRNSRETDLNLLEDALIALGTIGGIGAKSRKGYGSLVLQSLRIDKQERWTAPQSIDDMSQAVRRQFSKYCNKSALPEFTAFSSGVRHVLLSSNENEALKLLDLVGRELVRYRSWGRGGKLFSNQEESEKNFKDDHDLMKQPARNRKNHPHRIAFGLPHNYGSKRWEEVSPWDNLDRRASPLFIHIHECGDKPVAVLSFLPAQFLPQSNGKSPCISVGGQKVAQKPEDEL